ncbi:hypothetical protein EMIT0P171_120102 [Pseudomonas sp. IT-P171]
MPSCRPLAAKETGLVSWAFRELAPAGVVILIRVLRELIWRYRQQAGSHRGFCVVVGVWDWP